MRSLEVTRSQGGRTASGSAPGECSSSERKFLWPEGVPLNDCSLTRGFVPVRAHSRWSTGWVPQLGALQSAELSWAAHV